MKPVVAWIIVALPAAALAVDLPSAAEKQNWPDVTAQIQAGKDLNVVQADGACALHWAAYHDKADMVEALLAAGARADLANRYGITPLLLACENGSDPIVRALLKAGANANAVQRGGETALMVAARTGRPGPVRALIEKGAKVNAQDRSGQTALMWAAAAGHEQTLEVLLQNGADVNHRLKSGFTALLFAAREGKSGAARVLLDNGADIHDAVAGAGKTGGRDAPEGMSAMLLALENGHFELALELIERGADPNDMRSGCSALHTMAWVRKPPRGDDEAGQPPPETHGRLSSMDFIRELVKAGGDVNLAIGKQGRALGAAGLGLKGATPFLLACKTADVPLMKLLVELGADPLRPNADGSTPLMVAAGLGCRAPDEEAGTEDECVEACEYLISKGADVNAVDRHGETAMHGAAYKSLPKVVRLLAAHGASVPVWNQKNANGWTPLLIAQGFRPGNFKPSASTIEAISTVLLANGVKPSPPPARESLPKTKGYKRS